jgi:small subunit ribosomal protein S5
MAFSRGPRMKKTDDFADKNLDIRRVTRVVAGGKRFRFRATIVVGNRNGKVGVGTAKGVDVAAAVEKARTIAKKNVVLIPLKNRTIPHEVEGKYSSARVIIKPASKGYGLVAGGAVRAVLSLAGVSDATAKILSRTTNKLTNALAAINALQNLRSK